MGSCCCCHDSSTDLDPEIEMKNEMEIVVSQETDTSLDTLHDLHSNPADSSE